MHTKVLHYVSWIGLSCILLHSLQASSAVTANSLSSCVTSLAGESRVGKKEGGAVERMWSTALLILMLEGRPMVSVLLLWSSSCADLLEVLTDSTSIWGVTGPREHLNTVVVLSTLLHCLLRPSCDAVAAMTNERMEIGVVITAQDSKSLGYFVSMILTAKSNPISGDSLPTHPTILFEFILVILCYPACNNFMCV